MSALRYIGGAIFLCVMTPVLLLLLAMITTREVLAKIYHCGYAGFKRGDKRGDVYWRKVKAKMKSKRSK